MNNNRKFTLNTNQNIIVEFTDERIIPASGLAVVGALLGKSDFPKKLNRMDVAKKRSQHQRTVWLACPENMILANTISSGSFFRI